MTRPAHYLRHNKSGEMPSAAVWFDTETRQDQIDPVTKVHHLTFGHACYRRRGKQGRWLAPQWIRFEDRAAFADWLVALPRPKTRLFAFCHNTAFDVPVLDLFGELASRGWKLKRAVIDAPPTILAWRRGGCTIQVLDTLNWWRQPLKAIGETLGLPKLDMPASDAPPAEWDVYARRDVEIIMEACLRWWAFLADNDLGNYASTLAGQAFGSWKHRFMRAKVLAHDNIALLELERSAYHGGRVECFKMGKYSGDFKLLDVRSMFPAMMVNYTFPARLAFVRDNPSPQCLAQYIPELCCLGEAYIETGEPIYGVVRGGKLIFPIGRLVAPLAGPELHEAWMRGHLRGLSRVAFYHPEPLFADFITFMWGERVKALEAGNTVSSHNFKILMNSLYGKFGQRGQVWDEAGASPDLSARCWEDVNVDTGERTRWRMLGGLVQCCSSEPEARDSVPAVAAYVTSYARVFLWRLIEEAGYGEVYYCDTDSILVSGVGARACSHRLAPMSLGGLSLQGTFSEIDIRGAKDYTFGDTTRIKGVRSSGRWVEPGLVEQEQWTGLKGQLRAGDLTAPTTRTVRKFLKRVYTKGSVGSDGVVSPFRLSEW